MENLKGVATIQLFNAETGELEQELKEENMITNAVEQILNPPDFFTFGLEPNRDYANHIRSYINPLFEQAFNGVLIFQDPIEENPNIVIPPWENVEIGHAGKLSTTSGENYSRIGTYNEVESGPITNGYRRVWDFATDRANGQISCVCLTSRSGGTVGFDKQEDFSSGGIGFSSNPGATDGGMIVVTDYDLEMDNVPGWKENDLGQQSMHFFYMDKTDSNDLRVLGKPYNQQCLYELIINNPYQQGLFSTACEFSSVKKIFTNGTETYLFWNWKDAGYEQQPDNVDSLGYDKLDILRQTADLRMNFVPYVYQNQIHIIYPVSERTEFAIRHKALNLNTYEIEFDKIIKLDKKPKSFCSYGYDNAGPDGCRRQNTTLFSWDTNYLGIVFFDNCYFLITGENTFCAFDENGNLIQEIYDSTEKKPEMEGFYIDELNKALFIQFEGGAYWSYSPQILINKENGSYKTKLFFLAYTGAYQGMTCRGNLLKIKDYHLPFYAVGGLHPHGDTHRVMFEYAYYYLFLATINNLSTPVIKTNGQTMKITYDIIQVED